MFHNETELVSSTPILLVKLKHKYSCGWSLTNLNTSIRSPRNLLYLSENIPNIHTWLTTLYQGGMG